MTLDTTDGRRARALENRRRATRAMLDLIRTSSDLPTAEAVADRAGLSRRTVFRLFEDLDAMRRAAADMLFAEVLERFPPPLTSGHQDRDVEALVSHRVSVYEHVMPVRRMAERLKWTVPGVRQDQARGRELERMHLASFLAPHLPADEHARREILDALQVATAWGAWATLRDDLGLGKDRAKAVMLRMVRGLVRKKGR